jgi:hypothetical protein
VFFAAVGKQSTHATGSVSGAGPPDRGLIAFESIGDDLRSLARAAGQDDPCALHLEPGERLAPGDLPQVAFVIGTENQWIGFSAAHGRKAPG